MKIWNREVGPGQPTFIVAEGGSNHCGSLEYALRLTDAAADAGADAMKWQLWLGADEMYDRAQFPDEWTSAKRWILPAKWLPALRDRAHERGIAFGLSSFGFASLDMADGWVDFHKVASIESGWLSLVSRVVAKSKPTLVSKGMSGTNGSLGDAITLHCVVSYPAELSDVNLRSHPDVPIWGLSDHTIHPTVAPCAAVAMGASVVEKHLRFSSGVDLAKRTPDYPHSLTADAFKRMVEAIRLTEQVLGSSEKRIRKSEEPYLRYRRGPRGLRGA